jgi:uncharacterized protein YbjT (DUF2867 family)
MGIQLRKLCRERVVVVFGGTNRIGRAAIELLSSSKRSVAVIAAVENPKGTRARRLKRVSNCFLVQFDPSRPESLRRAVRHADAVLLVPSQTPGGTRFAKHLIDTVDAEQVPFGLVLISSVLAARELPRSGSGRRADRELTGFKAIEAHARAILGDNRAVPDSRVVRFIALRVPLVMETILHCRDEIVFANRFVGCFAPTTSVPCISVRDVAIAAACALIRLMDQHDKSPRASSLPALEPIYTLTDASSASISPVELSRRLSALLGRPIKYCHLSDEAFIAHLKEKSALDQLGQNIVVMKDLLEPADHTPGDENDDYKPGAGGGDTGDDEALPSDLGAGLSPATAADEDNNVLRSTHDFRCLTQSELMTPNMWLEANRSLFERTPQNQVQLFVVGSGDSISIEVGQFLTKQITDPTTRPPPDAGEGALPSTDAVGGDRQYLAPQQAKVTLCTIKSQPPPLSAAGQRTAQTSQGGASDQQARLSHYYHVEGSTASPVAHLLEQLTALDVVLFIPPLRLGINACMEIVKTVTAAAARANALGIVVVSSIFAGAHRGAGQCELLELDTIEQAIKSSGVSYVIVRLPLFMEYLLALSNEPTTPESPPSSQQPAAEKPPSEESLRSSGNFDSSEEKLQEAGRPDIHRQEEEAPLLMRPSPEMASMYCEQPHSGEGDSAKPATGSEDWSPTGGVFSQQEHHGEAKPPSLERWPLMLRNLASSRLYWMSVLDAAKALVAISFTFPLHRNRTRTLFTESHTLEEVAELARSAVAQRRRSRSAAVVDLSKVDVLHETPGHEFWKLAFWPRRLTKRFLECAVDMSGVDAGGGLQASESYEFVTECPPISMERWMQLHAKSLSRALAPRQTPARSASKSMGPTAASTTTA